MVKNKKEIISDLNRNISEHPFYNKWINSIKYINKLISSFYNTKGLIDYNKIYLYTKKYWKQFDLYSFGVLIQLLFYFIKLFE